MSALRVDPSDWASKARLRCPEGHSAWRAAGESWYCATCGSAYAALVDAKTGERVERDAVEVRRGP